MLTDDNDYDDAEPVPDDVQMDDATAVKVPSVEPLYHCCCFPVFYQI